MSEKEQELFEERLKKLKEIRDAGIDPYPARATRTHTIGEVRDLFESFEEKKTKITLAGRIRAIRVHGGLLFGNIEDASGSLQFLIKEDFVGKESFEHFQEWFDIGDFASFSGTLMRTKKGEETLLVETYTIIAKSLKALPEKWHGLTDVETRLRKRYLDMLANQEVRELFLKKAVFWQSVRDFLVRRDFLEVETPVLESVPGGAEARPFITHHHALDRDFFLRISLELPLKRLVVGGFEKVFEIGRIFRNEGISSEHLQDYTQVEFYWAYADYTDLQQMLPEFYQTIVKKLFGTTKTTREGVEIDWAAPWKKYDYYDIFSEFTGLDLGKVTEDDLRNKADELGIVYEKFAKKGRLIDLIYKKAVRPYLVEPGFLLDPPVEIEPLAKRVAKDDTRVERLQVMAWGTELGKGFSELNDPLDQKKRFEEQMKLREAGDEEAQMMDEDYVEALMYGMPPTAGFGMSERLFAVLMDKPVRETVIFPPMKKSGDEK